MYHLHADPKKVAQALLIVMRRESLSAAEEVTGHPLGARQRRVPKRVSEKS